ncbi:hypothetical protein ACFE04_031224 [Oxalis oulophora]
MKCIRRLMKVIKSTLDISSRAWQGQVGNNAVCEKVVTTTTKVLDDSLRAISGFKGTEDPMDDKTLDAPFTSDCIRIKKVSSAPSYVLESDQGIEEELKTYLSGIDQWSEIIEKHMSLILHHTSATVKIGAPPRLYNVQIDTGSDILWITCSSCNDCSQLSRLRESVAQKQRRKCNYKNEPGLEPPRKSSDENRSVQFLGQIRHSSCRPRAILFKVLADTAGLESRLMVSNLAAEKWKKKRVRNFEKFTELFSTDIATGDHAETTSELRQRRAEVTDIHDLTTDTIDDIDLLASQNHVTLENTVVSEDDAPIEKPDDIRSFSKNKKKKKKWQ